MPGTDLQIMYFSGAPGGAGATCVRFCMQIRKGFYHLKFRLCILSFGIILCFITRKDLADFLNNNLIILLQILSPGRGHSK